MSGPYCLTLSDVGTKSVAETLAFMQYLRPRILRLLTGHPLEVPLESMDILKPERGNKAHVLFVGPSPSNTSDRVRNLKSVCGEFAFSNECLSVDFLLKPRTDLIHGEMIRAGFIVDEGRALKVGARNSLSN